MNHGTERFLAVLTGVEPPTLTTLCQRALGLLSASSVSIVLMSRDDDQGLAGASGPPATEAQDLEFILGQGPGVDAHSDDAPVLVEDLHLLGDRWPLYSPAALHLGIASVCALPLKIGVVRVGVLYLFGDKPGSIAVEDLDDALVIADLVTQIVIGMQFEATSETVAFALEESDYRAVVHQATGMISAQLECGVQEALVRLRGYAFASERPIDEVAEEVVSGSIRFDYL